MIGSAAAGLRSKTARVARILEKTLGVPRQELPLPEPLEMLVATILSQNTNDRNSHRAYTSLRARYRSWRSVANADLNGLISAIRSGGMANQKAGRIRTVVREVHKRYGRYDLGRIAEQSNDEIIRELTSFDGVGTKTAACVLLFSLGRDVFPVDTHVHRICGRLGLAPNASTPVGTFEAMRSLVPRGKGYSFHTNLIRFGRRICRANNPACGICPLFDECLYPEKARTRKGKGEHTTDPNFMLLDNIRRGRGTTAI